MGKRKTDQMGYSMAWVAANFSPMEYAAAKRLANAAGRYEWDPVGIDPRVIGWRFLRDAKIVLSGIDLGPDCIAEKWEAANNGK